MPYRLLLELELTVLELAAPPLAIDSLHSRVAFFSKISLVHRSLTAWAQDRLRDQFLYTYRPRPDEHARLRMRFEAGFGPDRPIRRLYLNLTELPEEICWRGETGTDSVSAASDEAGKGAQEQVCEAVAHFVREHEFDGGRWEMCTMIPGYSQALDILWLKLPRFSLNIKNLPPPRVLYIDNGATASVTGLPGMLPLASETVLVLRNLNFFAVGSVGDCDTRHMIFHGCWATEAFLSNVLRKSPQLETLVYFKPDIPDLVRMLIALPTSLRRVHMLEHNLKIDKDRFNTRRVLPHLESFAYTLLSSGESESQTPADDAPERDALTEVQQAVESIIDAPQCTVKYVQSMRSREDALADALAALKLDL